MTTATISFEIKITLEGSISPYEPVTRDYPGCDAQVDDLEVTDLGCLSLARAPRWERGSHPDGVWKTTSLLDGIDIGAPEMVKLRENILKLYREDAENALFDAQAKRAA